jgi:hypothetical protein
MRRRLLAGTVRALMQAFPAVAIVGPRQSGKTTLAKSLGRSWYDLEDEGGRARLDAEWDAVMRSRSPVILDEAQAHPPVFARLRGAIDADRKRHGRFLLLGSVSPALLRNISESLAGRLATAELTPFLLPEVPPAALDRLWRVGGYPDGGILAVRSYPRWQEEYVRLLAQRDLPDWGLPARPGTTMRLFRTLASVHAQVWNASEAGRSLGLSYHTVEGYLDRLEGAFLVRRLPAYHADIRKRLVKSPKVYWRDTGVLHALLGLGAGEALAARPWAGASWEGFVIEQALGTLGARGQRHEAFFLRTKDGEEIDLVIETGGKRWAVETKLSARPSSEEFAALNRRADLIGADCRVLVSRLPGVHGGRGRWLTDLPGLLGLLPGA